MQQPKKKILHTTTRLVPGGGVEKNIYYTIAGLKDEFEFHLSCGAEFKDNSFDDFPEVKTIICPYLINKISLVKDLQALWFYYRLIKKEKYDIVHTHETKASFITKFAAWLAKCPYIIYGLHGVTFNDPMSNLKRRFYILLEKLTINCSDLIVSVGYNTIEEYHRANIGKKIPYEIVRSGIDIENYLQQALQAEEEKTSFRKSLGINNDDFVMINIGRFSYSKAQRYTIEAFAALNKKYPNTKLLLVGEGELLSDCKRLAQNLGVEANTIFLGYKKEISHLLSISEMFIFTSLREGLPRVLVEAALLKVPIVTFSVEGAAEIIEHSKTGFIAPQMDVKLLTFYAEQLILQPELRRQFGKLSQQHVIQYWDKRLMSEQLLKIYNRNPL